MRYLARGHPLTRDEARERFDRMLAHWQEKGYGIWSVFHRPDGEYVGRCGLSTTHGLGAPELTYTFHRRFWGRGLATEGCRRVVIRPRRCCCRAFSVARWRMSGRSVMVKLDGLSKYFEHEVRGRPTS
jgi:hypothetical protein